MNWTFKFLWKSKKYIVAHKLEMKLEIFLHLLILEIIKKLFYFFGIIDSIRINWSSH